MTEQCPGCGSADLVVVDDAVVASPSPLEPPDLQTCLACGWTSFRPTPASESADAVERSASAETAEV
ncbi:MAG: hypothetical protein ABI083_09560 [Lapillicoccus sp.]